MALVNMAGIAARPGLSLEMLEQVRDVGGRMEHLIAIYDRLVQGLIGADVPIADPHGRLQLLGRQIEDVGRRVQELLVAAHDERREEIHAAFERVTARRPQAAVAAPPRRDRLAVIMPPRLAAGARESCVTAFPVERRVPHPGPHPARAPRRARGRRPPAA